jgi:hypothetical protein
MSLLNRVVATVLEALLWPFRGLPPLVGLAFLALLTAVVVLLVYRKTSDQGGITAVRRRIVASLLEMRLFRDDLVVVLCAQGEVLKASFRYFRYSLVPLAWILLPLVILFIHLDRIYGFDPLAPGEAAIVSVETEEVEEVALEAETGVAVETPALRAPGSQVAQWRIRGLVPGDYELAVRAAGHEVTKSVSVGTHPTPLAPTRPSSGVVDQLLHPGERPISSDQPVRGIKVDYRRATVSFLAWQVHWVVPFLVLTILFGFALQKPLGVKL